jgi:hypothetical protein
VEWTPKQFVTLDYERDGLEIDGPAIVIVHRHKARARIEIRTYSRTPKVRKMVDFDNPPKVD